MRQPVHEAETHSAGLVGASLVVDGSTYVDGSLSRAAPLGAQASTRLRGAAARAEGLDGSLAEAAKPE